MNNIYFAAKANPLCMHWYGTTDACVYKRKHLEL